MENREVAEWIGIAKALFFNLKPRAGLEAFGHGMTPEAFSTLVAREDERVDHALTAMAAAAGEHEVRALFAQLHPDTVIALCARWAHYLGAWKEMLDQPHPRLWMPRDRNDWWRAVLLSMTIEGIHSTAQARALWPGEF